MRSVWISRIAGAALAACFVVSSPVVRADGTTDTKRDPSPAPATDASKAVKQDPQVERIAAAGHTLKDVRAVAGKEGRFGHAEVLVNAPLAAVRAVVTDYGHYKDLAGGKIKTNSRHRQGSRRLRRLHPDSPDERAADGLVRRPLCPLAGPRRGRRADRRSHDARQPPLDGRGFGRCAPSMTAGPCSSSISRAVPNILVPDAWDGGEPRCSGRRGERRARPRPGQLQVGSLERRLRAGFGALSAPPPDRPVDWGGPPGRGPRPVLRRRLRDHRALRIASVSVRETSIRRFCKPRSSPAASCACRRRFTPTCSRSTTS